MNTSTKTNGEGTNGAGHKTRLGILQAGRAPAELSDRFDDYHRLFEQLLGHRHFEYRHWAALDGEFPDSLDNADAWLITGSKYGVYEDFDWIARLEDWVRHIYEQAAPMVGICFGHQLIAQALGGHVAKFDGGWAIGRQEYEFDYRVFEFTNPGESTALLAFHQDQVITPPAIARTVGHSDFCQHAALLYSDQALTIQAHPEFTPRYLSQLLEIRSGLLADEQIDDVRARLDQALDSGSMAEHIRRFLHRTPPSS